MQIAITGHLGTVGAPLMRALKEQGHDVLGIDSRHSANGVRADIANYRQLEGAFGLRDIELVYHLAAEFGRHNGEDFNEQCWMTNVVGTKNILRLQADRHFKMVFSSSSEVYGESDKEILTEQDIASAPDQLTNDYATSKWVNEGQIANAKKRFGNKVMTLRFFNAYGPGEHYHAYRSVVCLFVYRALHGLPYDVFDGYHRVFQYVDDLIDTLVRCTDRFKEDTINVGGLEYRSVNDMHKIVSAIVGVDSDRPLVRHLSKDAHNIVNKRPDISKAVDLLGHDPSIKLDVGIEKTVEWMREEYGV